MNRVRSAFAATLVGASLAGGIALAGQATQAPPMTSILAGKKFTPPIKGQAEIEFAKPATKREKDMVVTRIRVRNASSAPVPRLTIDESWYDRTGAVIAGGKGVINGLLQPGEIQTVTIETPWKPGMLSNNYNFTHANGTVKPKQVTEFPGEEKGAAVKKPAAPAKK